QPRPAMRLLFEGAYLRDNREVGKVHRFLFGGTFVLILTGMMPHAMTFRTVFVSDCDRHQYLPMVRALQVPDFECRIGIRV
ncbi:MAG TPA: hypothetical protein VN429_12115, partial [Methanospirillum sp.]|uniref:hypothetical protein n=1 Tax=Methanospirillum sp. TaxID=45200 RepID=UPI002C186868